MLCKVESLGCVITWCVLRESMQPAIFYAHIRHRNALITMQLVHSGKGNESLYNVLIFFFCLFFKRIGHYFKVLKNMLLPLLCEVTLATLPCKAAPLELDSPPA